jgi:predicted AlkP superfamily phosphohydrolase/phosphomutase
MSRRVGLLLCAALAVAAGIGFVVRSRAAQRAPRRPADRVILLGFDGVAPSVVEILVADGKLPNIQRLMKAGTYGHFRSASPAKSAILWTSIATGKTMLKHGIIDWTYVNKKGIQVPFEDRSRKVKTYWEILAERGVKSGTLNWWTSYPPAPILTGFIVSNAFRHTDEPGTVHPMRLYQHIAPLRLDRSAAIEPMKRLGIPEWRPEDATIPLRNAREVLEAYPLYVAQDLTVDRVSDYLWEHEPVEVFSTYFRLVDVTSHFAVHFVDRAAYDEGARAEKEARLTPEAEAKIDREFARVLTPVYQFMDGIVGKYLARMDERTALVVCSDHGFKFYKGAYAHAHLSMEPPDGVLFLAGPGIKKGRRLTGASLFDVAPTLLHLIGQPAAADMDGGVLRAAFEDDAVARNPVRTVATYESRQRQTAAGATDEHPELDKEVLDDLKTLGYIGGEDDEKR